MKTRIHLTTLKEGISRTTEFAKKGLADYAANVGTKCGHDCTYCSTGAMLRMHTSFKDAGENPFGFGYAIVDPDTPERVARDAERIKPERRGVVQLCTTVDAWAPEAQKYGLGRKCLSAILSQPGWSVRIMTKNAAVVKDFDLVEEHRDRVLVGLSLTAPMAQGAIVAAVEPYASPIKERMAALEEAQKRGLRTYGMLCPLLPGIADGPAEVDQLVGFVLDCGAEEVFVEPVNPRGKGLRLTEQALRSAGYAAEADQVARVRQGIEWSAYTRRLLVNVQASLKRRHSLPKLRFLLYPSRLTPGDELWIRQHDSGVRWLGKDAATA
jgi:DNA repair photolyase